MLKQREKAQREALLKPVDKLWKNQGFSVDKSVDKLGVSCAQNRGLKLLTNKFTSYPLAYPQDYPQAFRAKPPVAEGLSFYPCSKEGFPTTDYLFIT